MNLEDIAKLAGVSRSTVSRVVNNDARVSDEVRTKVQATIDAVGYRPNANARALASHRTRAIGLVVPEDFSRFHVDSWYPLIIEAMLAATRDAGQTLMLIMEDTFSPGAGKRVISQFVDSGRVDGLLILQHSYRDHLSVPLLRAGVPTIHIAESDVTGTSWVDNNNLAGGEMVGRLFADLGVHKPLCVSATLEHVPTRRRLDGFQIVYPDASVLITNHSLAQAEEALLQRLRDERYDAIFAINGWLAPIVYRVAATYGLSIPDELRLVSFDDFDVEMSERLQLTSVVQHTTLLASRAVRLLIDLVEGRAPPGEPVVLDSVLIPRGSCGSLVTASAQGGAAEE